MDVRAITAIALAPPLTITPFCGLLVGAIVLVANFILAVVMVRAL